MNEEDINALTTVGLTPIIVDENTIGDLIELDKNGRPKNNKRTKRAVATRNRVAGFTWEYKVRDYLKGLYPDITTTHGNSKHLDAQKIDFMNKDERKFGFLPFNLQAKTGAQPSLYEAVFRDIPDNGIPNVIAFKYTRKASSKFMTIGEYALMEFRHWLYYLEIEQKYNNLIKKLGLDNPLFENK